LSQKSDSKNYFLPKKSNSEKKELKDIKNKSEREKIKNEKVESKNVKIFHFSIIVRHFLDR